MLGEIVMKSTDLQGGLADMALLMVDERHRREQCSTRPPRGGFTTSVGEFFAGALGQPYGGFRRTLQAGCSRAPSPSPSARRADDAEVDSAPMRARITGKLPRARHRRRMDLASYLKYRALWLQYAQEHLLLR